MACGGCRSLRNGYLDSGLTKGALHLGSRCLDMTCECYTPADVALQKPPSTDIDVP